MNVVSVSELPSDVNCRGNSKRFALPTAILGRQSRPRWGPPRNDGLIERVETPSSTAWQSYAERLLQQPTGTPGNPAFRAVLLGQDGERLLLLALNHALCDYGSAMRIADAFVRGQYPGALMPASEELLPDHAYACNDSSRMLDYWWSQAASRRWDSIGAQQLSRFLPSAAATKLHSTTLSAADFTALKNRCCAEQVSLGNSIAIATARALDIDQVNHAVDMTRFIEPPPDGPGLAISHLSVNAAGRQFWAAARSLREELRHGVESGLAGDQLLTLPRALFGERMIDNTSRVAATLTGRPRGSSGALTRAGRTHWVVASARVGGVVINPIVRQDRLELLVCAPSSAARSISESVVAFLCAALIAV